jgi:hypothetical protein
MRNYLNFRLIMSFMIFFHCAKSFGSGKYAGAFLMNPVGARSAAMGCSYTAIAGDASAVYWNPAGLVRLSYIQITAMHSERFSGMINHDFFAAAFSMKDNTKIGIGYLRMGIDGIPMTRLSNANQPLSAENRPYVEKYLKDEENAIFISYAKPLNPSLHFGLNVKVLHKLLGFEEAWGLGFDVGAIYFPTSRLQIGTLLADGTSTILAWRGGVKEIIRPQLKFGAAYTIPLNRLTLLSSAEMVNYFWNDPSTSLHSAFWSSDFHAGLELDYQRKIAVRLGLYRGQFTAGAGFKIVFTQLDYCFLRHKDLGNSHLISVTLHKSKPKQSYTK